jgi:hypothetical protein
MIEVPLWIWFPMTFFSGFGAPSPAEMIGQRREEISS